MRAVRIRFRVKSQRPELVYVFTVGVQQVTVHQGTFCVEMKTAEALTDYSERQQVIIQFNSLASQQHDKCVCGGRSQSPGIDTWL